MITYVLCAIIAVQAVIYAIERKDLYNRITGEDHEKHKDGKPPRGAVSAHERVLKNWRDCNGADRKH